MRQARRKSWTRFVGLISRNINSGTVLNTFNFEISVQMPNVNSVLVQSAPRTSLSHVPLARPKRLEARPNSSGELVLIRGLPGSGKSTMAKDLATQGYLHFEADMYFELDGHYRYDASCIREAHSWCQK